MPNQPLRTTRRIAACALFVALLVPAAVVGPAASPASAACAAQNRTIGGSFVGEDGRQLSGLVGVALQDGFGRNIGMDGCVRAPGGYAAYVWINLNENGCCFLLGTNGATSGYASTWQIGGIPANAATAWVEGYPKSNTPDTTGYYHDNLDYRRYGGAMRRAVPINGSADLRLPLNCGLGGDNGTIDAVVSRNGAPANVASAWAFSVANEGTGQILGFVTSAEAGSGRFTIRALEPNQNYAIQINLVGGGSYWFEHDYGSGVPVQPCTTTTRSFVLDDASGRAIATGGGFVAPPGVGAVDVAGVRSVYTRGGDGSMMQQVDQAGQTPFSLGGQITGDPDATSWGAGVVDVVVRGGDGATYWRGYRNGGWQGWTALGGGTPHSPSVASWGPNRLDVFVTGLDNQLWHRWSGNGGASWSGWEGLGGILTSAPDAAAWGGNRLDIVARGQDGALWHRAWSGSAWLPWESLGGQLAGGPGAAGPASNRLELVVRGTDQQVYSMRWTGAGWTGFAPTGGIALADPDVAAYGGVATIYVRSSDGGVWRTTRSTPSSGLSGWSRL